MRIGLCLSGGGARGAFHMGALQAIDEAGLKISVISGCSAGALIGSLYAAGVKPETMLNLAIGTRWFNFLRPSFPNRGLMGMDYLNFVLKKFIPEDDFSRLAIPTRITATNMLKGILRVFDQGEIIKPVLASCSVPLLFKPILIDDEIYLDGGILMNLPASIIRNDCDVLIGVSLMCLQPASLPELNTSIKVLLRVLELSIINNSRLELELCNVMVETSEISNYSKFDLRGAKELFDLGYTTCKRKLHENKELNLK